MPGYAASIALMMGTSAFLARVLVIRNPAMQSPRRATIKWHLAHHLGDSEVRKVGGQCAAALGLVCRLEFHDAVQVGLGCRADIRFAFCHDLFLWRPARALRP